MLFSLPLSLYLPIISLSRSLYDSVSLSFTLSPFLSFSLSIFAGDLFPRSQAQSLVSLFMIAAL